MRAKGSWNCLADGIVRAQGLGSWWRPGVAGGLRVEESVRQGLDPIACVAAGLIRRVGYSRALLCRSAVVAVGGRSSRVERWLGAVSYFLVTFAPLRTLEISFCCGPK